MSKELLYKLIREEKVVLWAGAGMSLYAGYLSGNGLKNKIFEDLLENEKKEISNLLPLPQLAEEYIRLRGNKRNSLYSILTREFITKKPSTTSVHKKLADIPHIRIIVTTNYDNLFEKTIRQVNVVTKDSDTAYIDDKTQVLLKIHGDLQRNPDNIIITTSDFYNFSERNKLIQALLTTYLATKNILLIGYDLEDPNITALFDNVIRILETHSNQVFLVAPKLSNHKQNYLKSKNIIYIDSTNKILINGLTANIRENIKKDFDSGLVSVDTYRKFLNYHNMNIIVEADGEKFKLKQVNSINGKPLRGELTLITNDNAELYEFLSGGKLREVEIDVSEFTEKIEGIKFHEFASGKLKFIQQPNVKFKVDLSFSSTEILGIDFEIYSTPKVFTHIIRFATGEIVVEGPPLDKGGERDNTIVSLTYHTKHNERYGKVSDEINYFRFIDNLVKGLPYSIHFPNGDTFKFELSKNQGFAKQTAFMIEYFELLKEIENHYTFRFTNIDVISDENFDKIQKIIHFIRNTPYKIKHTGQIILNLESPTQKFLNGVKMHPGDISIQNNLPFTISLYGKEIKAGYEVTTLHDPIIVNTQDLLEGKTNSVVVKCENGMVTKTYLEKLPNLE